MCPGSLHVPIKTIGFGYKNKRLRGKPPGYISHFRTNALEIFYVTPQLFHHFNLDSGALITELYCSVNEVESFL